MHQRPRYVTWTLAAVLATALPAFAQVVLRDTFETDPPGGAPDGPEIGTYSQIQPIGQFTVVSFGGSQRVLVRDPSPTTGWILNYQPTAQPAAARTRYIFRIAAGAEPQSSNAWTQQLVLGPVGNNLSLLWGADSQLRIQTTIASVPQPLVLTGATWAYNTDYLIEWETEAATDTYSLRINGLPILTDIAFGGAIDSLRGLAFASNFPTTGTALVDNVQIETAPCEDDTTPPTAALEAPPSFSCVCSPVEIKGTADDVDGDVQQWQLEYQKAGSNTWTLIATGNTPVISNTLASWNAAALSEGYYLLRLTVTNTCNLSSSDADVVYLDTAFDTITVEYPTDGQIVGGSVCFDGTVYDGCTSGYSVFSSPSSTFTLVNPTGNVINDPFAYWETTLSPDGPYEVTVKAETICGNQTSVSLDLTIDNTPPVAKITSPENCDPVSGLVPIKGTVSDLHFREWYLYYTGGNQNGWALIASGNTAIVDDLIAVWDTTGLQPCAYTLYLIAYDNSVLNCVSTYQYTQWYTSVVVGEYCPTGCLGDFDGNGVVDFSDIDPFVEAIGTVCP